MVTIISDALTLTPDEKERLTALLATVSSHTLLKVLRDMEWQNADACLILEILLERSAGDGPPPQPPVIPR